MQPTFLYFCFSAQVCYYGPNLEYLNIEDDSLGWFVVNETPFLRKAFLDVGHCSVEVVVSNKVAYRAMELVNGTNNSEFLSLSFRTTAVIPLARHFFFFFFIVLLSFSTSCISSAFYFHHILLYSYLVNYMIFYLKVIVIFVEGSKLCL